MTMHSEVYSRVSFPRELCCHSIDDAAPRDITRQARRYLSAIMNTDDCPQRIPLYRILSLSLSLSLPLPLSGGH